MFLWNRAKRRSNKTKGRKKNESGSWNGDSGSGGIEAQSIRDNFIIRAKLPPEFTRGKQLFRKQVPIVNLRGGNLGESTTDVGRPIKLSLLTLEKKVKNPRNCPLCKQNLTTWFSQCVSCRSCDLRTCRSCADYNQVVGEWTCHNCVRIQNNKESGWDGVSRSSSKFWYDDILTKKGSLAQYSVPANTHIDRTTSSRYEQLEEFVSHHLSITPEELNITDVGKIYRDSKYDLLFSRYHEVISLAVEELLRTSCDKLQESISLKKLKELMNKVKVAAKLDLGTNMEQNPRRKIGGGTKTYEPVYPDILSTAILNRIIIDSQAKSTNCSVSPVSNDSAVVADYSSTSTELPESGSEKDTHNWVLSSTTHTSVLRTSDDESIVDIAGAESLGSSNWSRENIPTPQGSLKIEESIEEITTKSYVSSSGDEGTSSSEQSGDEHDYSDQMSPRSVIQEKVANWEHNWLFARRKELLKKRQKLLQEPVAMHVPNPIETSEVMIGNEKISDLEDDLDSLDVGQLGYVIVKGNDMDSSGTSSDPESPKILLPEALAPQVLSPQALAPQTDSITDVAVPSPKIPVPTPRVAVPSIQAPIPSVSSPPKSAKIVTDVVLETVPAEPESRGQRRENRISVELNEYEHATKLEQTDAETRGQSENNETISATEVTKVESGEATSSDSDSIESEQPKLPMRIAEREKEKWNHPVPIKYNPYAVENLNKRLKEKEFITLQSANRDEASAADGDAEIGNTDNFPIERRSLDKFRRDYYIHKNSSSEDRKSSTSSSSSEGEFHKIKTDSITPVQTKVENFFQPLPPVVPAPRRLVTTMSGIPDSGSDLDEIKLPSVRNLAKKFSNPVLEEKHSPVKEIPPKTSSWKPTLAGSNSVKQQLSEEFEIRDSPDSPENRIELRQFVEIQAVPEASFQNPSENLINFEEDTFASCCPSIRTLTSSSSSEEDLSQSTSEISDGPPPRILQSPSLYSQFSRSKSEPPGSTSPAQTEEIPWKSTRQMILELERRAQNSETVPIRRSQSAITKPVRPGAMEELSQRAISVPLQELTEDIDLKKLKRSIVRGARTSKGLSQDKEKELLRQDAVETESAQRVQDCEFTV